MNEKKLIFEGAEIVTYSKGNLENNPIIFLHGNSLSSLTFQSQFEQINLPLLSIDLPGHGKSSSAQHPQKTYSIPGYVEVLKFVVEELKLKNFILAGHSLGGHIAIEALPVLNSAKGLFIFGTPPLDAVASMGNAFLPNPLFPLLLQGKITEENADILATSMLTKQLNQQLLKADILRTDPTARTSFADSVGKGMMRNEIEILQTQHFNTAILNGKNDAFINLEYIEGLHLSNLWQNKNHYLNDCGHCPQIENPEQFNSILVQYYNSIF